MINLSLITFPLKHSLMSSWIAGPKNIGSPPLSAPPDAVFRQPWSISDGHRTFHAHQHRSIYDHCALLSLQRWWASRSYPTPRPHFPNIDWNALGKAKSTLSISRRHWISKHVAGVPPVGTVLLRRGRQDHARCPRCGAEETPGHVWRCQDPQAIQVWEESVASLRRWLERSNTFPPLSDAICMSLLRWKSGVGRPAPSIPSKYPSIPAFFSAFTSQESMGWGSFLEGRISHHWAAVQQAWFVLLGKKNTGFRWASHLITKLLNVAWDQWEHRNGVNARMLDNARHQLTTRLVAEELALGPRILRGAARRLFSSGFQLLTQSSAKQEAWLANIRAALSRQEAQIRLAQASLRRERGLMRRWLNGGMTAVH